MYFLFATYQFKCTCQQSQDTILKYCSYESLSAYIFMFFQTCNLFHVMNWKLKLLAFLLKYSAAIAGLIIECKITIPSGLLLKQQLQNRRNANKAKWWSHYWTVIYSRRNYMKHFWTAKFFFFFTHRLNATGAVFWTHVCQAHKTFLGIFWAITECSTEQN